MIWKDRSSGRHYLIPESAVLVGGSLELTTPAGKSRFVEETAVHPFEVSEEKAREWLLQQTGDILKEVSHALSTAVEKGFQRASEEIDKAISEPPTAGIASHASEWDDLLQQLAECYGQDGDDTTTAAARGLNSLLEELFGVIRDAASADASRRRQSAIRADTLEELLDDLDLPARGSTSGLPAKIEELIGNWSESDDNESRADALDRLADMIEYFARMAAERLQQTAEDLRQAGKARNQVT